jgi:hypothetical protein
MEDLGALAQVVGQLAAQQGQLATQLGQLGGMHAQQAAQQAALVQALHANAQAQPAQAPAANGGNVLSQVLKAIKPPEYSGEKDALELDTWFFSMGEYFSSMPGITEDQKVLVAGLVLKGQAATWWRDLSTRPAATRPQTWQEFKDALTVMFMPVDRAKVARDKLRNAHQRERDSLISYTTYMRSLFLSIPDIAEGEKVDRFVGGLIPSLRKEVLMRDATTLEEAIKIATKHDALRRTFGKGYNELNWKHPYRGSFTTRSADHRKDDPMELGAIEMQNKTTGKGLNKKGKCFNCGKEGHHIHECPEPRKPRKNPGPDRKNGPWRRPRGE